MTRSELGTPRKALGPRCVAPRAGRVSEGIDPGQTGGRSCPPPGDRRRPSPGIIGPKGAPHGTGFEGTPRNADSPGLERTRISPSRAVAPGARIRVTLLGNARTRDAVALGVGVAGDVRGAALRHGMCAYELEEPRRRGAVQGLEKLPQEATTSSPDEDRGPPTRAQARGPSGHPSPVGPGPCLKGSRAQ
jgi:hypothetical protein